MTYCLGILLPEGLLLASDSRSNAGVDHVVQVCKFATIVIPGNRVIAIQSAGNLATSQSVVTQLKQAVGSGASHEDLALARTMFDVATIVGAKLREVVSRDAAFVKPYGDPTASFLVSGPDRRARRRGCSRSIRRAISSRPRRAPATCRSARPSTASRSWIGRWSRRAPWSRPRKLALLSFDATMRSNLSVGRRSTSCATGRTPSWRRSRSPWTTTIPTGETCDGSTARV